MGVNPGDYRAVMLLLESLKGKQSIDEPPKKETIKETTSSTEVVPAKDNSTATSCKHINIYTYIYIYIYILIHTYICMYILCIYYIHINSTYYLLY